MPLSEAELLNYAAGHYANHTTWFLKHRDTGIASLVGALTIVFALTGYYYAHPVPERLVQAALLVTAVGTAGLTRLALKNCEQAYKAALEHAILTTKIMWASGIRLADANSTPPGTPVPLDAHILYVPRYIEDAIPKDRADTGKEPAKSTKQLVEQHLKQSDTTYFATRGTILVMCIVVMAIALGSIWGIEVMPRSGQ